MNSVRTALVTALTITAASIAALVPSSAAQAVPVPEEQRAALNALLVTPTLDFYPGSITVGAFTPDGAKVPDQTTYSLTVSSCGRVVGSETSPWWSVNGPVVSESGAALNINFPRTENTIGPDMQVAMTVTSPGFDPYTLTATVLPAEKGLRTPSCENVAPAQPDFDAPAVVSRWSTKKTSGRPRVGKVVKVSPTKVDPAGGPTTDISYRYYLGEKNLARDKSLNVGWSTRFPVKRAYKNKKLFLKVAVHDYNESHAPVEKVIALGKVRG